MNRSRKLLTLSLVVLSLFPASGAMANPTKKENGAFKTWASNSIDKIAKCKDKTVKYVKEHALPIVGASVVGASVAVVTVLLRRRLPFLLAPSQPKEAFEYFIRRNCPEGVYQVLKGTNGDIDYIDAVDLVVSKGLGDRLIIVMKKLPAGIRILRMVAGSDRFKQLKNEDCRREEEESERSKFVRSLNM